MFAVSLLPPRTVRRVAFVGFAVAFALLALTFVIGVEIKGARRWINLPGLSLQPSEFVKPTFAIVAAWLFAEQKEQPGFPGNAISIALFLPLVAMLVKQPDLGMAVVVALVWFAQFFMAGLRLYWVAAGGDRRRCRARRRLSVAAARDQPDQPLSRSGGRRQLPGQPLAGGLRQWRAVGPRPGRGQGQGRAARRACRFRLRGGRRGVRRRGRCEPERAGGPGAGERPQGTDRAVQSHHRGGAARVAPGLGDDCRRSRSGDWCSRRRARGACLEQEGRSCHPRSTRDVVGRRVAIASTGRPSPGSCVPDRAERPARCS